MVLAGWIINIYISAQRATYANLAEEPELYAQLVPQFVYTSLPISITISNLAFSGSTRDNQYCDLL